MIDSIYWSDSYIKDKNSNLPSLDTAVLSKLNLFHWLENFIRPAHENSCLMTLFFHSWFVNTKKLTALSIPRVPKNVH